MDKLYWDNVLKARKEIYDMMIEMGAQSVRAKESANPYYNQITDNGGIGLEFYYGLPSKLYTPLGQVEITCDFVGTCAGMKELIAEKVLKEYGAVLVDDEKKTTLGIFGPVYAITKLPWQDKELPVFEYRKKEDYIKEDEAQKLYNTII